MNIGAACSIFMNIDTCVHTDEEKALAIYKVLQMPTHNGVNKDSMLRVIKFLFDKLYEVEAPQ